MKRPVKLCSALVLSLSASIMLAGCWDRIEIIDRLYPLAIAIDVADKEPPESLEPQLGLNFPDEKDQRLQQMSPEKQEFEMHEKFLVTLEIPIFKELAKSASSSGGGGEGGGKGGKPAWLLASTGTPIGTVMEQLETRSYRPISLGHLKMIIIGEKAARLGINEYLAFFRRQHEMDRKTKVGIARGEAKDVLSVDLAIDRLVGLACNKIISSKNTSRTFPVDIGKISTSLSEKRSFVLPRVIPGKRDLKVAGLAVFRGDKMVGWLGEQEAQGLLLVAGKDTRGTIAGGKRCHCGFRTDRRTRRSHRQSSQGAGLSGRQKKCRVSLKRTSLGWAGTWPGGIRRPGKRSKTGGMMKSSRRWKSISQWCAPEFKALACGADRWPG